MAATSSGDPIAPDRRQFRRIRTLLSGRLTCGDRVDDGIVLDLSVSGAKVTLAEPAARGATVRMRIARLGEFTGEVIWRGRGRMGVRFLDDPTETSELLAGLLPQDCLAH